MGMNSTVPSKQGQSVSQQPRVAVHIIIYTDAPHWDCAVHNLRCHTPAAPLLSAREFTVISRAPDSIHVHASYFTEGTPEMCVWFRSFACRAARSHGIFWSVAFCPRGGKLRSFESLPAISWEPAEFPSVPTSVLSPAGTKVTPSAPSHRARGAQKRLTVPCRRLSLFCLDNCIVKNYLSYI